MVPASRSNSVPWLRRLAPIILIAAVTWLGSPGRTAFSATAKIDVGEEIPALHLSTRTSEKVEIAAGAGPARLLLFLRHHQKFEQMAVEDLRQVMGRIHGDGLDVRVVWVARSAEDDLPELGLGTEPWFDPDRAAAHSLGIIVYPTTLLVSKTGKIAAAVSSHPLDYASQVEQAVRLELGQVDPLEVERLRQKKEEAGPASADVSKARLLASFAGKLARDGKIEKAREEFGRAQELAGSDPQVVHPYAEFLLLVGDQAEAKDVVDRFLKENPSHTGLQLVRARIMAMEGLDEPAAALIEKILPLCPDQARARLELGKIREKQGRWQEAATHYREALQLLLDQ